MASQIFRDKVSQMVPMGAHPGIKLFTVPIIRMNFNPGVQREYYIVLHAVGANVALDKWIKAVITVSGAETINAKAYRFGPFVGAVFAKCPPHDSKLTRLLCEAKPYPMAQFNLSPESDASAIHDTIATILEGNMEQARNIMGVLVIGKHEGRALFSTAILKKSILECTVPRRLAFVYGGKAYTLVGEHFLGISDQFPHSGATQMLFLKYTNKKTSPKALPIAGWTPLTERESFIGAVVLNVEAHNVGHGDTEKIGEIIANLRTPGLEVVMVVADRGARQNSSTETSLIKHSGNEAVTKHTGDLRFKQAEQGAIQTAQGERVTVMEAEMSKVSLVLDKQIEIQATMQQQQTESHGEFMRIMQMMGQQLANARVSLPAATERRDSSDSLEEGEERPGDSEQAPTKKPKTLPQPPGSTDLQPR